MRFRSFYLTIFLVVLLISGGLVQLGVFASSTTEINYWMWHDYPEDPFLFELVNEFNGTHPDIKVKLQVIPWDTFHEKLITAIAAGTAPEVARVHVNWLGELTQMEALRPLDDLVALWPGGYDVKKEVWDLLRVENYGDTKFVVPFQFLALYLYYRTDLFEAENLNPPTTYKEFLKTAHIFTKDTDGDGKIDLWGYGMRGARGGHDMWNTFANFFNRDGSINLDKDAVAHGTEWYADLFRKEKVSPPSAPSDGFVQYTTDFANSRTAMIIHHIGSSRKMIEALGDKVAAAPVPEGLNGGYTSAVPEGLAIIKPAVKSDAEIEAAFKFISWWGENKQVDRWCRHVGSVPVVQSLAEVPYFRDDPFQKATIDSMKYAGFFPRVPETGSFIEDVWPTTFGRLLLGEIIAEEAVQNFYNHYNVKPVK